jgi:Alpha-L-arabinofuranosidase 1 domain/3-keto-disaccharide hydrolase
MNLRIFRNSMNVSGSLLATAAVWWAAWAQAEDVTIRVDARQPGRPVSRYLTGACIEDVNHEIYGGIYSQMIFGESFQEPPRTQPVAGFVAVDGEWRAADSEVTGSAGPGPKLVGSIENFTSGEAGVELFLPDVVAGNAGLIVRVDKAGPGADNFDGYEVSIDVARKTLVLGRHQHDFRLLKEAPCEVAPGRWISLAVKLTERTIECFVDGRSVVQFEDQRPLAAGTIGLRQWQRTARYRSLWVKTGDNRTEIPLAAAKGTPVAVSGMWRPVTSGTAELVAEIETADPFIGIQSQKLLFARGSGEVGIENQGLNRWGLALTAGRNYEGYVWVRADKPTDVWAVLENRDGSRRYAENRLTAVAGGWQKLPLSLTPDTDDRQARFGLVLKSPGSIVVGHAFLQPGGWGRFHDLPVRRDVVEGLIDQGVTVLRYGGSMVNAPEYRWKNMIGPRDKRPPYRGTWYPYSTNGWGIVDFLDLCEAAKFLAIPAFHMDETPQDLVDLIEYVNGPADSPWGTRRSADGHPRPYELRYLQLGNEERIDEKYFEKFRALAEAIWAKDARITLAVGDFVYNSRIVDPFNFSGAESRITSLAGHRQILDLARRHDREVWFDIHIATDGPEVSPSTAALPSYADALEKIAQGAKHKVVVFELNAGNPRQRRALANAQAIGLAMRDGRFPVVTSANCLQPDGQNDNGWDQGLLFLNPSGVWLQPPGHVTRMLSRYFQPRVLDVRVEGSDSRFDVTATRSEDGKTLVLQVVNASDQPQLAHLEVVGDTLSGRNVEGDVLAGPLEGVNTAADRERIRPLPVRPQFDKASGLKSWTFAPYSITVLRFD